MKSSCRSNKLNTESLQSIGDPHGWITSEAILYFLKSLEEDNPNNRYMYLHQALFNQQQRKLYAQEINVKGSENIYFIFNRSLEQMFDFELRDNNHWAVGIIRSDGEVLFADALYKNPPANFTQVIGDYYMEKFGRKLKPSYLVNLSGKKNFPTQRDSSSCGLIALMVLVLCQDELITEMFKFNGYRIHLDGLLDLVFEPSCYKSYLRIVFQTAYSEGSLSVASFISSEGLAKINRKMNFLMKDKAQFGKTPQAEYCPKKPKSRSNRKGNQSQSEVDHAEVPSTQQEHCVPATSLLEECSPASDSLETVGEDIEQRSTKVNKRRQKEKRKEKKNEYKKKKKEKKVETSSETVDIEIEDLFEDLEEDKRLPNIIDCPELSNNMSRENPHNPDVLNKKVDKTTPEKTEHSSDDDKKGKHAKQMGTSSKDSNLISPNFVGSLQLDLVPKFDRKGNYIQPFGRVWPSICRAL